MFRNYVDNDLERGMRLRSRVLASPISRQRLNLGVQQPPTLDVSNGQCQGNAIHSLESPVASQQGDIGNNASGSSDQLKELTSEEKLTIFQQMLEDFPDFVQICMDKVKKTEDEKSSQSKRNGSSPFPCGTPIPSE